MSKKNKKVQILVGPEVVPVERVQLTPPDQVDAPGSIVDAPEPVEDVASAPLPRSAATNVVASSPAPVKKNGDVVMTMHGVVIRES